MVGTALAKRLGCIDRKRLHRQIKRPQNAGRELWGERLPTREPEVGLNNIDRLIKS